MPAGTLTQLEDMLRAGGNTLPPVHAWHPPLSGDIDIRIARDGTWYHQGTRFERPELVRLFASILRREGDEYFLVSPVEKWRMRVDEVPFVIVDMDSVGEGEDSEFVFHTNVGDVVHLNELHALRVEHDPLTGEPAPFLPVRDGLEAKLARSVYYRLVEVAVQREEGGVTVAGIWSGGRFFELGRF